MKIDIDIKITPVQLAEAFCEMYDEDQAQFFIECARIASTWKVPPTIFQWHSVGRHLKTCSCSNDDARDMVREIAQGIE